MRLIPGLLIGLALAFPAAAEQRPIVVELFTSQGCSSCPPADALLNELAQRPDVLPLAFHVTYWDRLGWRDPFSLDLATNRQRAYQGLLGTETIYTPQMIVEGHIDVVGSDRSGVRTALAASARPAGVPITVSANGGQLSFSIGAGTGEARVLLVGYDAARRTAVPRGENAGHQLSESNIVRSLAVLGAWQGQSITLASPIPAAERAAVILQARDGRILGAALVPRTVPGVAG